jgi:hypothetical protein
MSQFPPTPPPGYPAPTPSGFGPPMKQTNGIAVASLICGLLGCVPVIGSLLAVIFGFLGISKARDPRYGGKGMAIAGVLLGIFWFLGWAAGGYGFYRVYVAVREMGIPAKTFVQAMESGDIAKARTVAAPTLTDEQLTEISRSLRSLGALKDFKATSASKTIKNGVTTGSASGTAVFENGTREFAVEMQKPGDTWQISRFELK